MTPAIPTLTEVADFTRELRRIGQAIAAGDLTPEDLDEFMAAKRELLERIEANEQLLPGEA